VNESSHGEETKHNTQLCTETVISSNAGSCIPAVQRFVTGMCLLGLDNKLQQRKLFCSFFPFSYSSHLIGFPFLYFSKTKGQVFGRKQNMNIKCISQPGSGDPRVSTRPLLRATSKGPHQGRCEG